MPPGQSRIVTAPSLPTNATGDKLVLTGDDEDFDNTVYVLTPGVEHVNLLVLGDEPENDPTRPLYYLKRAFQETPGQVIEIRTRSPGVTLAPSDLADTRLLIAMERLSESQLASAQDFMNGGGTVLLVMTNSDAAADAGRLAGVGALSAEEVAPASYALLGSIDFSHPLFAQFSDARYNDFTRIHFWKYRRLDPEKITGARVLAKFDNGDPALLEIPRGKGLPRADVRVAARRQPVRPFLQVRAPALRRARPVRRHQGAARAVSRGRRSQPRQLPAR